MTAVEILATNLTASGYGASYDVIRGILSKLTEEEIHTLTGNLFRTAEKMGMDAFDCHDIVED